MNVHTPHLSLREIEVMRLAAEGMTAKETARLLHLSESAVNLYLSHARHKLNARTKVEAIAMLLDGGTVLRESIDHLNRGGQKCPKQHNDHLQEMLALSNTMRHLIDDMLGADAAKTSNQTNLVIWNELAEKMLKMAAHACGYEVIRAAGVPQPENA